MENDCHIRFYKFSIYQKDRHGICAVHCFPFTGKKQNVRLLFSNDMCSQVCASRFLYLENTARALIHLFPSRFILKVHSIPVT